MAPHFNLDPSFKGCLSVKVGSTASFKLKYASIPLPTMSLMFNCIDVSTNSRITYKLLEENAVELGIINADKQDAGDYEIELTNTAGKATLSIKLIILCKCTVF